MPLTRWGLHSLTDSFENFRDNSLKGGLSNATTFNPPLFSLVDTFNNVGTMPNGFSCSFSDDVPYAENNKKLSAIHYKSKSKLRPVPSMFAAI